MSLLRELQEITEQTYRTASGVNLEKFIIGKDRFRELSSHAGQSTIELSDIARVFFRKAGDKFYLAIYFSRQLIASLEAHDPRRGLHDKNIYPFMVFIEEINHGLHAAIKFLDGERNVQTEDFIRDLELLAKIDSYQILKFFMAWFNPSEQLEKFDRLWLKYHLFERSDFSYRTPRLATRYEETNRLGEKYTRFLDGVAPEYRSDELRRFRAMSYVRKVAYVRMLPA